MLLLVAGSPAAPAPPVASHPVTLPAGTARVQLAGTIRGREIIDYTLPGNPGDRLRTRLTADNRHAFHNILLAPPERQALFIGSTSGASGEVVLPASGVVTLRVYLMRNAAPRDERAEFTLEVERVPASS